MQVERFGSVAPPPKLVGLLPAVAKASRKLVRLATRYVGLKNRLQSWKQIRHCPSDNSVRHALINGNANRKYKFVAI